MHSLSKDRKAQIFGKTSPNHPNRPEPGRKCLLRVKSKYLSQSHSYSTSWQDQQFLTFSSLTSWNGSTGSPKFSTSPIRSPSSQAFRIFWGAPVSQRNVIWHCQAPGSGQEPTVVVERHGYWIHWNDDWMNLWKRLGCWKLRGSEGMFAGSLENSSLASEMSSSKIILIERIPQSSWISHILAIKNRLKLIISKRTSQKIMGN